MTGLKKIDFEKGFFMANGSKYIINGSLSTARYAKKDELELELSFGTNYSATMALIKKAYASLNGNQIKPADAAVHLYNIMQSITDAQQREPTILRYCALFCNEVNEDISVYDDDVMQKKIDDWHAEGLDVGDFFILAVNLVEGFKADYLETTQNSLKD